MAKNKVLPVVAELLVAYARAQEQSVLHRSDPSRLKYLRASGLPFCPVAFFVKNATYGRFKSEKMETAFYTSIGSAVHTVMQTYMGFGGQFLADWECTTCRKWKRLTTVHECCDSQMKYHEVEIKYKGIVGHVDAIFVDKQGRYWILDFKTASVKGAATKATRPDKGYKEQVEAYALLMELQYKIKIAGTILMFIKRDGIKDPVVYARQSTKEILKATKVKLAQYKKQHKEVLNVRTKTEALALIRHGKCGDTWCRVCTSSNLKSRILEAYRVGQQRGHLPLAALCGSK